MKDWSSILSRDLYGEFQGRCVIVAGGASGIGAALADGLHWLGARVILLDKSADAAEGLSRRLTERTGAGYHAPLVFAADLADEEERVSAIRRVCKEAGPPRAFISTLGYDLRVPFERVSQAELELLLRINFIAPVLAARDILPEMRAGGGGAICLFTSRHGSEISDPDLLGYGAAKSALDGGMKRLALQAGKDNSPGNIIRVFGFCPGWVQTEKQRERFDDACFERAAREQLVPLGMMPEDIVPPVIFNISRHANLLSGRTFFYDGGEGQAQQGAVCV